MAEYHIEYMPVEASQSLYNVVKQDGGVWARCKSLEAAKSITNALRVVTEIPDMLDAVEKANKKGEIEAIDPDLRKVIDFFLIKPLKAAEIGDI